MKHATTILMWSEIVVVWREAIVTSANETHKGQQPTKEKKKKKENTQENTQCKKTKKSLGPFIK